MQNALTCDIICKITFSIPFDNFLYIWQNIFDTFIFMHIKKLLSQKGAGMDKFIKINERNKFEVQKIMPDDEAVSKLAVYFQSFSDSTRLKILSCLSIMDMCVNDLSKVLNINQTTISHQLKTLKDQNLVEFKREGKILVYRIKSQDVEDIMAYAVNRI